MLPAAAALACLNLSLVSNSTREHARRLPRRLPIDHSTKREKISSDIHHTCVYLTQVFNDLHNDFMRPPSTKRIPMSRHEELVQMAKIIRQLLDNAISDFPSVSDWWVAAIMKRANELYQEIRSFTGKKIHALADRTHPCVVEEIDTKPSLYVSPQTNHVLTSQEAGISFRVELLKTPRGLSIPPDLLQYTPQPLLFASEALLDARRILAKLESFRSSSKGARKKLQAFHTITTAIFDKVLIRVKTELVFSSCTKQEVASANKEARDLYEGAMSLLCHVGSIVTQFVHLHFEKARKIDTPESTSVHSTQDSSDDESLFWTAATQFMDAKLWNISTLHIHDADTDLSNARDGDKRVSASTTTKGSHGVNGHPNIHALPVRYHSMPLDSLCLKYTGRASDVI